MREERLRTAAAFDGAPALALSAWRGRSGRRYVVGVHTAEAFDLDDMAEAVTIAVRRGDTGVAELLTVATSDESPRDHLRRVWLDRARRGGATELHVHRLGQDGTARGAIAADLRSDAAEPPQV